MVSRYMCICSFRINVIYFGLNCIYTCRSFEGDQYKAFHGFTWICIWQWRTWWWWAAVLNYFISIIIKSVMYQSYLFIVSPRCLYFVVGDVSRPLVSQVVTEVAKLKQQAILNQVFILSVSINGMCIWTYQTGTCRGTC